MAAFKLYGYPTTCTRRVAVIAKERNIPYEYVQVDLMKAEHKQPGHLEHSPFGQVPYIALNDGFELYESRAIGRYLATLGSGPELVPTEPKARANFEQAESIEYGQFDPIAVAIANEKVYKQYRGQATNEERLKELIISLENKLDAIDKILSKQKYLAGDEITLADLFFLPYGSLIFEKLGYGGLEQRPNVQRWWKEISSRPAWQAVKDGP
ncbi:glutathione S-transferase-like protein [Russula dissimulans]|nr:glutathione S-transferase-like protein [Russula dissimulans]